MTSFPRTSLKLGTRQATFRLSIMMRSTLVRCFLATLSIVMSALLSAQSSPSIPSAETPTNTGSTAIANLALSTLSVLSFGAAGNGSTDDTAAINAAMSACTARTIPHNGCILYFPSGVYRTTGLSLSSYIHIKGDGWQPP